MYHLHPPSSPLLPYIECYWFIQTLLPSTMPLSEMLVVDTKADILFNFGDVYHRQSLPEVIHSTVISRNNIDAHRTHPIQVMQTGNIRLCGVRFKPGGLAAFVPMPAFELTNQVLDMHLLFGQRGSELEEQLFEMRFNPTAQIACLNTFFLRQLAPPKQSSTSAHIAHYIEQSAGTMRIEHLSREIGYSIRTVDRLFRQVYGVTPSFYARVVRFHKALHLLQASALRLSDIALHCGYYDQAHFNHDFAALAGTSPEMYRQQQLKAE